MSINLDPIYKELCESCVKTINTVDACQWTNRVMALPNGLFQNDPQQDSSHFCAEGIYLLLTAHRHKKEHRARATYSVEPRPLICRLIGHTILKKEMH